MSKKKKKEVVDLAVVEGEFDDVVDTVDTVSEDDEIVISFKNGSTISLLADEPVKEKKLIGLHPVTREKVYR